MNNQDNTINFMYFISNYSQNFIFKIWSGHIANHFQSKFTNLCERYQRSDLAFLHWFYELSTDNQNILLNWVNQNYCASQSLKLQ
jgi:hypothetical protein